MAIGPIDPSAVGLVQPHAVFDGSTELTGKAESAASSGGFSGLFMDAVSRANASDNVAHDSAVDLAAGRTDDIHGTMIEGQKANIEMKLVGTIRNKVVDAFYELWRMSV
jgi:flagellar hook-basal body complex protein FliE